MILGPCCAPEAVVLAAPPVSTALPDTVIVDDARAGSPAIVDGTTPQRPFILDDAE